MLSVIDSHDEEIRNYLHTVELRGGDFRTQCPLCGPYRSKKNQRTLSVRIEDGVALWMCHHCEEKGRTRMDAGDIPFPDEDLLTPEPPQIQSIEPMTPGQYEYLKARGISKEAANRCGLINGRRYVTARKEEVNCIGFPYVNRDKTKATKWRDDKKNFTQTGAASTFWRIEKYKGGDLIITEGEMDALSYEQCGVFATSVPNGAIQKVSDKIDPTSKKFSYLANAEGEVKKADRILISTDNDDPGDALAEELARRIGKSRCWRVKYPEGCKDANDVLVNHGEDGLKKCLEGATPWPIGGLRNAAEYEDQAVQLYRDGMDHAIDVKVGKISDIYRPSPGTLVIMTGIPGSGKSTFLTWLSFLMADKHGWPCAVFAAETTSQVHLLQLAALRTGKPFMGPGKMTEDELRDAIEWVDERFFFIDESKTTVDSILERAQAAVMRNGCRVLMIDPFNFISGDYKGDDDSGTHAINKILVRLKNFATEHDISVWLVAHPKKMERVNGKNHTPGGYDISGSAHFFNVTDNGLTLERDPEEPGVANLVSWKSRFKWIGALGKIQLAIDANTGLFSQKREWGSHPNDFKVDPDV